MKMARLVVPLTCLILWATAAYAQKAGLATDTQHGAVGAQVCNGCHTPHSGTNANAYLWNKQIAAAATVYTTYTSPTLGNATTNITSPGNGALTPGLPQNNSLLCLSCHDGALAATNGVTLETATYGTAGGAITGTEIDIGNTLANDHPVNMEHDPANDTGLQIATTVTTTGGLTLYTGGAVTNTVQCGSCHDPHKQGPDGGGAPGAGDYLRKTNAAGALCLTCHL